MTSGLKAYQNVANYTATSRQTDATCFKLLIEELEKAQGSNDPAVRRGALTKNQRFWSLIIRVNMLEGGVTAREDRRLIIRMANQAQRLGILALLDDNVSLEPLIDICRTILEGLEAPGGAPLPDTDTLPPD